MTNPPYHGSIVFHRHYSFGRRTTISLLVTIPLLLTGAIHPASAETGLPTIVGAPGSPVNPITGFLHTDGTKIVDADGNDVVFHGTNFSGMEYGAGTSYVDSVGNGDTVRGYLVMPDSAFDYAAAWGFNVLRVPIAWADVEPTQGHYNSDYLSALHTIVDRAHARHLAVMFSYHQVGWSPYYKKNYAGMPLWVFKNCPYEDAKAKKCEPIKSGLEQNDFFTDTGKYSGTELQQEQWVASMQWVLRDFAQDSTVIGIEPFNEASAFPDWGPPQCNPPGCIPYRDLMAAFYKKAYDGVRSVNPQLLVGIQDINLNDGTPFAQLPGTTNVVYTFHAHTNTFIGSSTEKFGKAFVDARISMAENLNVPLWVSEFYRVGPDPADGQTTSMLKYLGDHDIGWTQWAFQLANDELCDAVDPGHDAPDVEDAVVLINELIAALLTTTPKATVPTTTTLETNTSAAIAGQAITFTATVTSESGTPIGTVSFSDSGILLGSAPLTGGHAVLTVSSLAVGSHSTIIANYTGVPPYIGSTSTAISAAVRQAGTTITLTASPHSWVVGQPVTFTGTVNPSAPSHGPADGRVAFSIDGASLGNAVALNAQGQAVVSTSTLALGSHSVIARFVGSASYAASGPASLSQQVFAGSQYKSLSPTRILDTRVGTGTWSAPVGSGEIRNIPILGRGGVPSANVTAVVLNVAVTNPTDSSYLTVYPAGVGRPNASNLNFVPGQTVANLATTPIGADGMVSVYNHLGNVDVIFDVAGYYQSPITDHSGLLRPLVPTRLLDTRTSTGGHRGSFSGNETFNLQVLGQGGVPSSGVSAVIVNLAVTDPTTSSFLTAFPAGSTVPEASNLNFTAGQTVPNRAIVKVGSGGRIALYNHSGSTDVVVDVNGYMTDATASGQSGSFVPMTPTRILDTRTCTGACGAVGGGGFLGMVSAGLAGVPGMSAETPPVAVVLNVAATNTTAGSFTTVYPSGNGLPTASDLNYVAGQTVPNAVIVKVGSDGRVLIYNHAGNVDLVADIVGYYY